MSITARPSTLSEAIAMGDLSAPPAPPDPERPCTKRPHLTQREAEREWARLKAIDPDRHANLIVYWCATHWAWHLGHRRRTP